MQNITEDMYIRLIRGRSGLQFLQRSGDSVNSLCIDNFSSFASDLDFQDFLAKIMIDVTANGGCKYVQYRTLVLLVKPNWVDIIATSETEAAVFKDVSMITMTSADYQHLLCVGRNFKEKMVSTKYNFVNVCVFFCFFFPS